MASSAIQSAYAAPTWVRTENPLFTEYVMVGGPNDGDLFIDTSDLVIAF